MAWYIDSLDPRAGMAFVSQRRPDLTDANEEFDEGVTAFIEPPEFQPSFGVSRAMAFAAGRGASQMGLFLGGNEVAFPSLAAAAEFVRRTYLRSGGSDDPGTTVPPVPIEGGPDLGGEYFSEARDRDGESDPVTTLKSLAVAFLEKSKGLTIEHTASEFVWQLTPTAQGVPRPPSGVTAVVRGAARVLEELLRRCPPPTARQDALRWREAARRLCRCFDQMGLWPFLGQEVEIGRSLKGKVRDLAEFLQRVVGFQYFPETPDDWWPHYEFPFLRALLVCGPSLGNIRVFDERYWRMDYLGHLGPEFTSDPFGDLAYFPIPQDLQHLCFGNSSGTGAKSLCHLISAIVAAPKEDDWHPGALEVLLFAAAFLVSPAFVAQRNAYPWNFPHPLTVLDMRSEEEGINQLVTSALAWLEACLPGHAFAPELENAIASAIDLTYAD